MARYADPIARALLKRPALSFGIALLIGLGSAVLASKLRGHYNYYGLTHNYRSLEYYYRGVCRVWRKWLNRRSRKLDLSWPAFNRLLKRHPLPLPRVVHSVYR